MKTFVLLAALVIAPAHAASSYDTVTEKYPIELVLYESAWDGMGNACARGTIEAEKILVEFCATIGGLLADLAVVATPDQASNVCEIQSSGNCVVER